MTPSTSSIHRIVAACRKENEQAQARANILRCALAVQEETGYVSLETVSEIARGLGVTEADVAGVLSFYPDLRTRPVGRHVIRVCLGESCLANHASRLLRAVQEQVQVELGETTADGRFTLERVYCVGNCAVSPTVAIGLDIYGRVTPQDIPLLLEPYR